MKNETKSTINFGPFLAAANRKGVVLDIAPKSMQAMRVNISDDYYIELNKFSATTIQYDIVVLGSDPFSKVIMGDLNMQATHSDRYSIENGKTSPEYYDTDDVKKMDALVDRVYFIISKLKQ